VRWQDDEGSGDKSDEDDGYADDEAEQGSSGALYLTNFTFNLEQSRIACINMCMCIL
jgi:hypothetical protein